MKSKSPSSAKRRPGPAAGNPRQVPQAPRCKRCHEARPLDDDGFCDDCRRKLEEACL